MTITEKLFALKATSPFHRLRDLELALIAEAARYRRYAPGETVCSPDKPLRRLHVVVDGCIEGTGGSRTPVVFGIGALLFDRAVSDSWRAGVPEGACCLLINKGNLHTMIYECPGLVAGLLEEHAADDLAVL